MTHFLLFLILIALLGGGSLILGAAGAIIQAIIWIFLLVIGLSATTAVVSLGPWAMLVVIAIVVIPGVYQMYKVDKEDWERLNRKSQAEAYPSRSWQESLAETQGCWGKEEAPRAPPQPAPPSVWARPGRER